MVKCRDRLLPSVQGVWLDKGEFDKIIEQSKRYDSDSTGLFNRNGKYRKEEYKNRDYPKKKKVGFPGDLFDFE